MDLFDIVRAAPPPENVREPTARAASETDANKTKQRAASSSPEPVNTCNSGDDSDTDTLRFPIKRTSKSDAEAGKIETTENTEIVETADIAANLDDDNDAADHIADDVDDVADDVDDLDGDDDDDGQPQPAPPKTKAQQKMFADVMLPLKDKGKIAVGQIRPCIVRIKRLSQSEIQRYITGKAPKRGRPRKNVDADGFVSPPKKQKIANPKVHIKLTQNGTKQRESMKFTRAPTPPPPMSTAGKSLSSKMAKRSPLKCGASAAMIRRYGRRVFSCVVNVKRLKHSNIAVRTNRKSKSKLSVSFSEAVEILGSKPRKSSSIGGNPRARSSLCASVPTRLQRVDATGNVVEDIELSPNVMLKAPSAATAAGVAGAANSSPRTKRSRAGACNSGRRGRKPRSSSLRVPVSGLASLSIDDSQADNETGDEYIVPNDLPEYQTRGVRRSGTPSPVKRVTTTTVSDNESEEEKCKTTATVSTAKDPEKETEPLTKETKPKNIEEPDEQEIERLQWVTELDTPSEKQEEADTEQNQTANSEQQTNVAAEADAETNAEADAEADADAKLKAKEQTTQLETEEEVKQREELEKLESELDAKLDLELDASLSQELEAKLDAELDTETALDNKKTSPIFPAIADDVTTDDILEIQTSIEDVRELQTPPSRQNSPPVSQKRSLRFESPESDSSFKSAHELDTGELQNTDKPNKLTTVPKTHTSEASDSDLITPNASQNTFNGSEPASSSSIVQPPFSPIGDIPNLDDDELGQLVAPDFQMSNSRHAISRGTLDDIMTVLES
ncbi:nuclear-pore anchor [Drosophila innubila]|uniref:nuclear-pore anchor n=1 Tax=Drosophila innubila TaxID=198719 RepID=UPI00148BACFB|nr:nuclear-pore anchor [Drosophila innubila]